MKSNAYGSLLHSGSHFLPFQSLSCLVNVLDQLSVFLGRGFVDCLVTDRQNSDHNDNNAELSSKRVKLGFMSETASKLENDSYGPRVFSL